MTEENLKDEILGGIQTLLEKQTKEIEKHLSNQTVVILNAVDERVNKLEERFDEFDEKLNKLTTTLDKFLKRMTDVEDEFAMIQQDLKRVKQVIKEKLGVNLL